LAKIQDPKIAGLIGSAYHALRDALVPFVESELYDKDKERWTDFHQERREAAHAGRLEEDSWGNIQWDAYGLIRSIDIDFSYIFRRAYHNAGLDWKYIQSIIVQLVHLRNSLIGHPYALIDETQAFIFLVQCRELFDAMHHGEYARHIRTLIDEFQSAQAHRLSYIEGPKREGLSLGETSLGDLIFSQVEELPQWSAEPTLIPLYPDVTTVVKGLLSSSSRYFRFGFKFMDARDRIFSAGSIQTEGENAVIHLGKDLYKDDLFVTIYQNGLRKGTNQVVARWRPDLEFDVKLEITKSGHVSLALGGKLAYQGSIQLRGPRQLVLLAWGDENIFECRFREAKVIRSQ